uniref:Xylulose kinase n=2 Tax=Glycine subgen. Soja TaxID=1462606 RepID=A0A0R0JI06_SOYBN
MPELSLPQDSYFLGFDSSTQSLKATVLDSNLNIVASELVRFDSDLPHYKTKDGVYRDPSGNGRIVSPTLMWLEALDLMLQKLSKPNFDFAKVAAVSGSGQQHGSLENAFSIKESPIWMDSSTTAECRAIEKAFGGALELVHVTGSHAYERFTGPQIKKIFDTRPEIYSSTERISLVSSFMARMNLMDIKSWSKVALEATAPGLESKLGELAPAYAVAGNIAPYFVERYHFNKDCLVVQWSGDNPNSVAGLTLNIPGDLAISLGTSDTVFMITKDPNPGLEGHVFPNQVDAEGYMVMLVYKNGSLTREDVRNCYADKSWDVFNKFLQQTQPLNVGFHRYIIENFSGTPDGLKEKEVRALIEGQLLSMWAHAERFGMPSPPKKIIATGGASANHCILSAIASIFGCDVYTVQRPDSASLGAALRAAHGWLCNKKGGFLPISDMYMHKLEKTSLSCKLSVSAGDQELVSKYATLMNKRIEIENQLVQKLGRC